MARIRSQIRQLPACCGVYLMKDADGRVLYIGKAKHLRDRVGSYFQPSADLGQTRSPWIAEMADQVVDIGHLECESEVDAILYESRLIKDIQPPYNSRQTDDKTFPYLEITLKEDFPGVYVTRQPGRHSKLYGPFTSAGDLRRVVQVLQRVFRFRTCRLEIRADDEKRHFFRPCILHDIRQCSAPCADRIAQQSYRDDIRRFQRFLESKRSVVLRQLHQEMAQRAENLHYEEAARLRDEIRAIESLSDRGEVDEHVQPELFQVDPAESLERLGQVLGDVQPVRIIEGIDIAHIQGAEAVGSLVCFIDGRPFKNGYRRFRIRQVRGIDDYAMIQEVLRRRYRKAGAQEETFPHLILIDGGLGQLHAARDAFAGMPCKPPLLAALAKREESIFLLDRQEPLQLSAHDPALRLLQYVRDEAHRYAQHYFHILRRKSTIQPTKPAANEG
ncbi:MAG: UvrB/UvrC motif-containing protein [Sedimentisphaerales bacterium]|nr:UvrB/UvrC motif-containing protein [Sedimentisphaerales bacterium]